MKRDSSQCWAFAEKQSLSDDEKVGRLVAGAVIGGTIGIIATSAANEEANKPKSSYRRGIHDDCMRKRGYEGTYKG